MKKRLVRTLQTLLLAGALAVPGVAAADGPEVFRAQSCTTCHSVTAAGIARVAEPDEKAKDLSKVGATRDKKSIALFLLKKTELDGEKHKKSFAGTTQELKTIAEWLETLK